ncbi:TorD/DmsD family molecular chaperone [Slackia piriformis]|uniref:Uncharacterized protein n=1 Tax=Slackia piriformis YIT 12062 TaxID=742818 RepID=K0YLJ8_9ACTN|nr:molecular chaperone TorD family protein [Slackia piriformis]EJZ84093.1 hypothetical protein HMPREF9451_00802 [Slackia piriformis YIT 12062]
METREQERRIAMMLARRAYLCGMFHAVFGGGTDRASADRLFGTVAQDALAWLDDRVRADGALASRRIGASERTLGECAEDAVSCIGRHADPGAAADAAQAMRDDYPKLFQVPGAAYVRPWESPYVNADGMLFRASTLDVRSYYHRAGFRLKAEKRFPDDHIAAMMDYMARMCRRAYEEFADGDDAGMKETLRVQAGFMQKHMLTWVDAFADKVIRNDERAYYGAFAGAMAAFAHIDEACVREAAESLAGQRKA